MALLIWGGFIYLVITDQNKEEDNAYLTTVNQTGKIQKAVSDSFNLLLNYRDPFSAAVAAAPVNNTVLVSKQPAKPNPIPAPVTTNTSWPDMAFSGIIKNTNKNTTIAIVRLNGQSVMLKEGEKFGQGLVLTKLFNDSLIVTRGKEKKVIKK